MSPRPYGQGGLCTTTIVPSSPRYEFPARTRTTVTGSVNAAARYPARMCRSIRQLRRADEAGPATTGEARAAALQYVRKVSGFRAPAAHNREVFDRAVEAIAAATAELLDGLEVRGAAQPQRAG